MPKCPKCDVEYVEVEVDFEYGEGHQPATLTTRVQISATAPLNFALMVIVSGSFIQQQRKFGMQAP